MKNKEKIARRSTVLQELIAWKICREEAWAKLGISCKQVTRLKKRFLKHGEDGLIHWLIGKQSNHHLWDKQIENIIDILKEPRFKEVKPTMMSEKLKEIYNISCSKEKLRQIMIKEGAREAKNRKHHIYRQKRQRRTYKWELEQFDGSYHKWIPWLDEEFCLFLAIDDATSHITHAVLCENESYENISKFWIEYIKLNGIPQAIYLDKFSTYKINHAKATYDKSLKTNFDKACRKLWCKLIFANSPQAKWRVERNNQTLQDRFIHELQIRGINTLEEANEYLQNEYIPWHNERYGVIAKWEWNIHKKREWIDEELEWVFAKEFTRIVWNDYIVQYKNRFYQLLEEQETAVYPKKKVIVREHYNGNIVIEINEKVLKYKESNATSVKMKRASFRYQVNKTKKEKENLRLEDMKAKRHKKSKERQAKYRAQRLIRKSQNRKNL